MRLVLLVLLLVCLCMPRTSAQFSVSVHQSLSQPSGVCVDSAGNAYLSDGSGARVLKVSPTGSLLFTFTTSNPALKGPSGVAVDALGNVYIADSGNGRVVMLNSTGAWLASYTGGTSTFTKPQGLAVHLPQRMGSKRPYGRMRFSSVCDSSVARQLMCRMLVSLPRPRYPMNSAAGGGLRRGKPEAEKDLVVAIGADEVVTGEAVIHVHL